MFERILVPFPPDSPDVSVASYAVELAEQFGPEILILTVLDRPQQRDQIRADQEDEARQATDPVVELAEERGVDVERVIRSGQPEEQILGVSEEDPVDLIVMGTQARTGVDRLLLGSVAESVVREATVPVLTVTPSAATTLDIPAHEPR